MNKNCHKIDRKAIDQEDYNKLEEENFKYIILPEYITKDKTNRIEQLQKLLEQQQEDLETEKIKRLKTAIEYFDDILKSNEPNRYILECLIDKIWIYHDKSVKFELKPEISRLI